MEKIIILIIFCICLCGCEEQQDNKYSEGTYVIGSRFTVFVDEETCVEYFVSDGYYNVGNIFPRYNQDKTLKLNKECLNDLESKGK